MSYRAEAPILEPWTSKLKTRFKRLSISKTSITEIANDDPDRNWRCHWRPSLQKYILSSWTPSQQHSTLRSVLHNNTAKTAPWPYLLLPQELRDSVESFLSAVDVLCLRQTCVTLWKCSVDYERPRDMKAIHRSSLRRRLDRDYFPLLCELERTKQLPRKFAVCSSCLTIHTRKHFDEDVIRTLPSKRECLATRDTVRVLSNFVSDASELRSLLEQIVASDGQGIQIVANPEVAMDNKTLVRSKVFDYRWSDIERFGVKSRIFADERGFILDHEEFDSLYQSRQNVLSGCLADAPNWLCVHYEMQIARLLVHIHNDRGFSNEFDQSCPVKECGVHWGRFIVEDEFQPAFSYVYFRMQKRLGWLEDLPNSVPSQTLRSKDAYTKDGVEKSFFGYGR